MGLLMPLGAVLVAVGLSGSAAACYQSGSFTGERATGHTDTRLAEADTPRASVVLAPLSGLCLAAGVVLMGIGIGHWKRPVPSDVRPANPWSDKPSEHGDPPKGLV